VLHGLGQGLYSGATVVARGLTGIVTRPIKGGYENGVGGAVKGFRQGIVGVVIMIPLAYIGFAERFYKGMGATFQAKGKLSVCGTRRPPRILLSLRKRKQIQDGHRDSMMEKHKDAIKERRNTKIQNQRKKKMMKKKKLKKQKTPKKTNQTEQKTETKTETDETAEEESSEEEDDEGHRIMQRLFDVDDASLASHVTMRIHKIENVRPLHGKTVENAKIVVRVNLYTKQTEKEISEEMTWTKIGEDFSGQQLHDVKIKAPKVPWLKLQSYTTTAGSHVSGNRNDVVEFNRDDFTFHLDRMAPKSEDLQRYLIRGCSLSSIKFKIRVYEVHTMRKYILAETELEMNKILNTFPVRDPEPFKEKHDTSVGAMPNMAWTHISDISQDKRRVTFERLSKLKKKRSMRVANTMRTTSIYIKEQQREQQPPQSPHSTHSPHSKSPHSLQSYASSTSSFTPASQSMASLLSPSASSTLSGGGTSFGGVLLEGPYVDVGVDDDSADEDDLEYGSDSSIIASNATMTRKASARRILNAKNSKGKARTALIAGKRRQVREWDENFWQHQSEDPQLTVFETEADWLTMEVPSKTKERMKKNQRKSKKKRKKVEKMSTIHEGETKNNYPSLPQPLPVGGKVNDEGSALSDDGNLSADSDEGSEHSYLSGSDYDPSVSVTGSEDDESGRSSSVSSILPPRIQISGFIFRYRDHSVRMNLNKIK
jgi:hypothetical protein